MKKHSIIFFVSLILFTNTLLFPQTPPYYHYTSANGLPSSVIHDITQDKKGYIWFATNNGISKFNGTKFKNFNTNDGLNSKEIVYFLEKDNGEILIANYLSGVNLLKNDYISSLSSPEARVENILKIFLIDDTLYAFTREGWIQKYIDSIRRDKWQLKFKNKNDDDDFATATDILKLSDGSLFALTPSGIHHGRNFKFQKLNIKGIENSEITCAYEDRNGNIIAGGRGFIYVIKNFSLIKKIETGFPLDKLFRIMTDSNGNIWFSILNKGFCVIYSGTNKVFNLSEKIEIPKAIINKFYEDNEGNIWVVTYGKGVFCFHDLFIENYSEVDGLVNNNVISFETDNFGRLIIGTMNGMNLMSDGKFDQIKLRKSLFNDYIYELRKFDNKIYVCSNNSNYRIWESQFKGVEYNFIRASSLFITKNMHYIIGMWSNNYYEGKNLQSINSKYSLLSGDSTRFNRVNEIYVDSENNEWFGTALGLYKITNGNKEFFHQNEILNSSISSIIEDKNKNIWIAGDKGFASYNLKTSEIKNYTSIDNYDLTSSTALKFDNENRLWIGNSKGLYLMENNSVKHFNTLTGLTSNEINTLYFDNLKNILWIGTTNGFSSFDINEFDKNVIPPLHVSIENVKSGDSVYTNFDNLKFERENNHIYISYNTLNFTVPTSIKYQYKLGDKSEVQWNETTKDFLDFSSMEAGAYKVFIRARTQNSSWSEQVLLSFEIKKGFTETIYFQILLFLFATVLIMFIAKFRINFLKKKNREQLEITKRIDELKFQALSAMMNPHFVFNSLNSIQYLINIDKKKEANDYVAMMAKLIRKNLDTAQNSFIYLEEEISRLRLYLDIEKLRFGDKFSYEIEIGNDVNVDAVMIPNMIVQPFVENSIWHGIMKSGKPGKISVSFSFEEMEFDKIKAKTLLMKIIDNGVGLNRGNEIKSSHQQSDHVSKGIKIIEDRLRLLSKEIHIPQPIYIEDLSEKKEKIQGTEVTIYLPPELYKL